ncbi:WAT1-related protein At1g21890-like isoform X1 [Typha latifolia]|uniref:WAT1-related protein At1g21890-like isoform X1 n=1 Tax=Typha latifolia TaxID=4733 RepID=UPI003C2DCCC1
MASIGGIGSASMEILPYVLMTLRFAGNAVLMAVLRSVLAPSSGVHPVVFAAYQQLVATAVLSAAVLLVDLRKGISRPSVEILLYASLIGFLQYPIGEVLLTSSLRYITATFQSVGLNMIPVAVFVAAVACRRERFRFRDGYSQAKLWGALVAVAGSTVLVVVSDRGTAESTGPVADVGVIGGGLMVGAAVVALAASCILVESVAIKYPSDLTLSTMISVFGTLQTVVIALIMERELTSWRIRWTDNRLEILAILYGGIAVSGLLYLGHNWCIHKKGPVFASAFSPLVVVFSFLIEIFILGGDTQLGSVIGVAMVIVGLYLFLWAKAKDSTVVEGSYTKPLLLTKA